MISAFILQNNGTVLESQLQTIKEGAVIFAGINYNSNISDKSAWNEDIIVYVETEILFHLAGYNGDVFKRVAGDLFSLIKEMNNKGKHRVIHVRYFEDVEIEIADFFSKAEDIVRRNDLVSADNYAMNTIVNGCSSASDVIKKKAAFLKTLSGYGIKKASDFDYYGDKYHKFNLESQESIEKYEVPEDRIKYIKHISYVNILRNGKCEKDLRRAGHIVLTEAGKMLKMGKELCASEAAPLAINMYMLTNRLWFDLNKGFGASGMPSSFNVLVKSQMVLSGLLSQSVSERYDKARLDYSQGKITADILKDNIISLREETKRPEDITNKNAIDILNFISEEQIEIYQSEKDRLASDLVDTEKIKDTILYKDGQNKLKERQLKESQEENIKLRKSILDDKRSQLKECEGYKQKAQGEAHGIMKWVGRAEIVVVIGYVIAVVWGFIKFSAKGQAIISILVAVLPPAIVLIISIIIKNKVDATSIIYAFNAWIEKCFINMKYKKYRVDNEKIEKLCHETQTLNSADELNEEL